MPPAESPSPPLAGAYSVLLLPTLSPPIPFSQFDSIVSQRNRAMLYGSVIGNPDGSLTPLTGYQTVLPLSARSSASAGHEDVILERLRISSPPPLPPTSSATTRHSTISSHTRAQSVPIPVAEVVSSSLRRNSRFSTPQPTKTTAKLENLRPSLQYKAFRQSSGSTETGGRTAWYHTEAPYELNDPLPVHETPEVGTVYVHTNTSTMARQIWVWTKDLAWKAYREGSLLAHPSYPDRYLWVHEKGLPTWVRFSTLKNYQKQAGESISKR